MECPKKIYSRVRKFVNLDPYFHYKPNKNYIKAKQNISINQPIMYLWLRFSYRTIIIFYILEFVDSLRHTNQRQLVPASSSSMAPDYLLWYLPTALTVDSSVMTCRVTTFRNQVPIIWIHYAICLVLFYIKRALYIHVLRFYQLEQCRENLYNVQ